MDWRKMKFFIYARKSTDNEERQMLSIEAQLAELREYAGSEGLTVTREFIIAAAHAADATGDEIAENLKWWSLNRDTRSWFETHYPKS